MVNIAIPIFFMQVCTAVPGTPLVIFTQAPVESVTVHGVIVDSLSNESIPLVKVTIEDLGKSFNTSRSSFYLLLPAKTYAFVVEANDYETLKRSIPLSPQNTEISFAMVKVKDRLALRARQDTLRLYLATLEKLLIDRTFSEAEQHLAVIRDFGVPPGLLDSIRTAFANTKNFWIDSLLQVAKAFEDSSQFVDAAYYYDRVIEVDSLNTTAKERLDEMNKRIAKEKTVAQPPSKTAAELQKMYDEAVAKFLAEDYDAAYKLFKTFLVYKPNHEGAKDYFERTKARLKVLE